MSVSRMKNLIILVLSICAACLLSLIHISEPTRPY